MMHVVLISNCEKRALKKTRAILDSYALRSGDHAWMTPITAEGLDELRAMLRRTATRQTSVACFRNDGRSRMRLLWIVGNRRNFDRQGVSPVATQTRKTKTTFPEWARVCAAIAQAAGHMHDIGKFGTAFQSKLSNPAPVADLARHEWISLLIVREMIEGASWHEAWARVADTQLRYRNVAPFDKHLQTSLDVMLYLIATHHRLPRSDGPMIGVGAHVKDLEHVPLPKCAPTSKTLESIRTKLEKLKILSASGDHLYWRAVATVARMALILADHSVSAEKLFHQGAPAYANTDRETGHFNQNLDWHLEHVGYAAGDMIFNMLSLAPPVLSDDAIERINAPARGRFEWQEKVSRALIESNRTMKLPHLVLNMAGTGSGKTRANVRAICALNEGGEVRVATALNLRTLTLQTADAYSEQLRIDKDELACVIGDRLTRELHEYQKSLSRGGEVVADDDENPVEDRIESVSEFEYADAPEWLKRFTRREPRLGAVIGAPVLVSTVDFLIAAGEPHRQGHHALAALRLMSSDLVLDEIDGYEPMPLLAVLRLTMMAALFGRNVVASSATLSRPIARLLWQAYARGAEMRGRLTGQGAFKTAIVDDRTEPRIGQYDSADNFLSDYSNHVDRMLSRLAGQHYRIPFLQRLHEPNKKSWGLALCEAVSTLHNNQSWVDPSTGKRLSIGLVRMANVRPAVMVAKYLAHHFCYSRVACYHAQHFAIQRFHIEQRLDFLLNRNNGDGHILADPEIRELLDDDQCTELMLIVVATPVEEIGRDHDFDWAVIEPSSSQSIVQTAGRVNRHRMVTSDKPNIGIMQFNRKFVDSPDARQVFTRPGLETGTPYPSHDLAQLFDWQGVEQVDARMRFGKHPFAEYDDKAIESVTAYLFSCIASDDPAHNLWMASKTYTESPLRDKRGVRVELTLEDPADSAAFHFRVEGSRDAPLSRRIDLEPRDPDPRAWLSLSDEECASQAATIGIENDDAMCVSMTLYPDREGAIPVAMVRRHLSFGFYRC